MDFCADYLTIIPQARMGSESIAHEADSLSMILCLTIYGWRYSSFANFTQASVTQDF